MNTFRRMPSGARASGILFLDVDDVVCLNDPYGIHAVSVNPRPPDLFERLFAAPAAKVLLAAMAEHSPRVVITSSWLRLLDREGFEALLHATALGAVAEALHDSWEAPQDRGMTRLAAIEKWLRLHGQGEPFVVLDDTLSGTGLATSRLKKAGRVVLCEEGVGLQPPHLEQIRQALTAPSRSRTKSGAASRT